MAYKQHFIEWFSGKQLPSYWNVNTNSTVAMADEVDGGIKPETISDAASAGANVFAAATSIFAKDDYGEAIGTLRQKAQENSYLVMKS